MEIIWLCAKFLYLGTFVGLANSKKAHHVVVSDSRGLHEALADSLPGDMIILLDGSYAGPFIASVNGDENNPIFVIPRNMEKRNLTIFGSKKEPAFTVHGNHWRIFHLNFEGYAGLHITGDDFWGNDLVIRNSETGMILQGHQNIIMRSYVADASQVGILVKGDKAILSRNAVIRSGIAIQVSTSSCCGYLKDNVCDGAVQINGTKIVERNTIYLRK